MLEEGTRTGCGRVCEGRSEEVAFKVRSGVRIRTRGAGEARTPVHGLGEGQVGTEPSRPELSQAASGSFTVWQALPLTLGLPRTATLK